MNRGKIHNADVDKVWKMIKETNICMLVTPSGAKIHARPMSTIARPEQSEIVMLTEKSSNKDHELASRPSVALNFCNGNHDFVSLQGIADISDERALIRGSWNPGAPAFWPQGPEDPNIEAIIVTPTEAEYWADSSGLFSSVKMLFAIATGQAPDLGEHKKIAL